MSPEGQEGNMNAKCKNKECGQEVILSLRVVENTTGAFTCSRCGGEMDLSHVSAGATSIAALLAKVKETRAGRMLRHA